MAMIGRLCRVESNIVRAKVLSCAPRHRNGRVTSIKFTFSIESGGYGKFEWTVKARPKRRGPHRRGYLISIFAVAGIDSTECGKFWNACRKIVGKQLYMDLTDAPEEFHVLQLATTHDVAAPREESSEFRGCGASGRVDRFGRPISPLYR